MINAQANSNTNLISQNKSIKMNFSAQKSAVNNQLKSNNNLNDHLSNLNMKSLDQEMSSMRAKYSRKKRLFSEMDLDAQGLEKGLSSLTLTKKIKLNSDNQFVTKVIPFHVQDLKNISEINSIETPIVNMDNEKKLVECYYAQKNKILFDAMFGNK
jgi:hypothetical protein